MKNLVLFRRFYYFDHINDILEYILNYHKITYTVKYEIDTNSDDIWLGIWNDIYTEMPKHYIMFNIEPMNLSRWKDMFKQKIEKSLFIIDYSYTNVENYKQLNMNNYKVMPFGYCSFNEEIYNTYKNKDNIKDIDILFYGSLTDRRNIIVESILELSIQNRFKFVIRNNNLFNYDEKTDLISRSKIIISIASSDPKLIRTNDLLRLSFLLSNKVFFITERIGDTKIEDNILGDYIVYYSEVNELLEKIVYYMNNEDERNNKVNRLYEYCKEKLNIVNLFPTEEINNILKNN